MGRLTGPRRCPFPILGVILHQWAFVQAAAQADLTEGKAEKESVKEQFWKGDLAGAKGNSVESGVGED